MGTVGGISIPKVPPAAIAPNDISLSYPRLSMSGRAIKVIVIVPTALSPLIAANRVQIKTVPTARPPLTGPNHLCIIE